MRRALLDWSRLIRLRKKNAGAKVKNPTRKTDAWGTHTNHTTRLQTKFNNLTITRGADNVI
jgi:hypothetical protein